MTGLKKFLSKEERGMLRSLAEKTGLTESALLRLMVSEEHARLRKLANA